MAAARYSNNMQRHLGSPRTKGRDNKDTLCRNVLIYGHCRYEDQGCTFNHNHDQNKNNSSTSDSSAKRALNVESPSFTPSSHQQAAKKSTFSSQAASAAPFTPRGANATPALQRNADAPAFNPTTAREFTPQNYDLANSVSPNSTGQDNGYPVDHFAMGSMSQALPAGQFNPYANDHAIAGANGPFFQPHNPFSASLQPPQYHLYAPIGPYREDLLPYQRAAHDFFLPERLREDLQKKAHVTLQVMPNTTLPQLDRYHTLFPLDTNNRKNTTIFGYPSWVFRATSSKTGNHYCLRRLEGYRLTNENAIRAAKEWKKIVNANVVTFHEAFTTRQFGDSSLIFCHDYHPLSKTLAEHHFPTLQGSRYRGPTSVSEPVLWGYICQIANALRAIHAAKLAARCIELSKIILSDKNRIRLSACSVLDVVQHDATSQRPLADLQLDDLAQFGKLLLSLATSTLPAHLTNVPAAVESLSPKYSPGLKDAVTWLLSVPPGANDAAPPKTIDNFIGGISAHMAHYADMALQSADSLGSELQREVENGRIARLLCKLGTVNERGEFAGDPSWSEHGDRYPLKLFRDYVFHQVDRDGNPRLELGHMLACLAKLDAAADEKVLLTSRDDQNTFILSYKELKMMMDRAFNELVKQSKQGAQGA